MTGATTITATTTATITSVSTMRAETARPMPRRSPRRAIGSSRYASAIPATNGSSTSLSTQSTATKTASAATQNVTCRSRAIKTHLAAGPSASTSMASFRTHVAHPFGEIEADRNQGQYRDQRHHQCQHRLGVKRKSMRGQHQTGVDDLDPGVDLGDDVGPDLNRVVHHPGQDDRPHDHEVARHHQDDDPEGNDAGDAE